MKKKIIAVSLALMSLCTVANADVVQTLTINGQTVEKVVSQLTFSGDNVVLHFGDTQESYALDDVTIDFSGTSGIGKVTAFRLSGTVDGTLSISGIAAGTPVAVYDLSGKKLAETRAQGEVTTLGVAQLNSGVYLLRAGNNIVKFVKR